MKSAESNKSPTSIYPSNTSSSFISSSMASPLTPRSPISSYPSSPCVYRSIALPIVNGDGDGNEKITDEKITNGIKTTNGGSVVGESGDGESVLHFKKYIPWYNTCRDNTQFQLKNVVCISNIWERILKTLRKMKIAYQEQRESGIIYFQSFYNAQCINMKIQIFDCDHQNYLFLFNRTYGDQLSSYQLYYKIVNNSNILKKPLMVPRILRHGVYHHQCNTDIEINGTIMSSCEIFMKKFSEWDLRFIEDKILWSQELVRKTKCTKFVETYRWIFQDIILKMECIFEKTEKHISCRHKTYFGCLNQSLINMITNGYSDSNQIDSYQNLMRTVIDNVNDDLLTIICNYSLVMVENILKKL